MVDIDLLQLCWSATDHSYVHPRTLTLVLSKSLLGRRCNPRAFALVVWKRRDVSPPPSISTLLIHISTSQAHSTHFWLNEGWTTYTERLILSMIHGPAERGFSYIIGAKGLKDDLELYKDRPKYQRLVIDFEKGEDPDDAYSRIPYEKGSNLILHLGTYRATTLRIGSGH